MSNPLPLPSPSPREASESAQSAAQQRSSSAAAAARPAHRPWRDVLLPIVAGALIPLLPFALAILTGSMRALDIAALMAAGALVGIVGASMGMRAEARLNRAAWLAHTERLEALADELHDIRIAGGEPRELAGGWRPFDEAAFEAELAELDAAHRAELDAAHARAEWSWARGMVEGQLAHMAGEARAQAEPRARGGRPRGSVWPRGYTLADYLPHLATAAGVRERGESLTDWARSHIWPDGAHVHVNTVRTWLKREAAAVEEWRTRNPSAGFSCTANPPPPVNRGPGE